MNLETYADICGTDKGAHQGFMPIYERYLPAADSPVLLVELGVQQGHSMKMWGDHFTHKHSRIIGVDIDLSQMTRPDLSRRVRVYQGDQADKYLADAVAGMRPANVVIDDASHISAKTIASFKVWWRYVKPGGLYVVEDTHTSYDTEYYGYSSARQPHWPPEYNLPTTMEFLKRLADDVNWNYHGFERFIPLYRDVAYVHFYPGITIIGKKSE